MGINTRIKQLEDLVEIQCRDGNWNYSPYMLGIANGLTLAVAVMKKKAPVYKEPPKEYLCEKEANYGEPVKAEAVPDVKAEEKPTLEVEEKV